MMVARIRRMSIAASRLFCRLNWIGEKAKLKMRFRMNGRATEKEIFRLNESQNT